MTNEITIKNIEDIESIEDQDFRDWMREAYEAYKQAHREYIEEAYLAEAFLIHCPKPTYRIVDRQKYEEWWENFYDDPYGNDWECAEEDFDNGEDAEECGRRAVENDDEQYYIDELVRYGAIKKI